MQFQERKINNGSCGQIGNLHMRGNQTKTSRSNILWSREGIYFEVWYYEWPTQHGIERQISQLYKSFSFGQEIPSLYWFNPIKNQEEGIPLGSILSVTLFNIKINSITNCLNPGIKYLFIDDFCITSTSKYICTAERQLQQGINKIKKWAMINSFKISKRKETRTTLH